MTGFWETNLRSLGVNPEPRLEKFLKTLLNRGPGPDLGLRSRTGRILPGVTFDGRSRSLVSTFDPEKEAQRWVGDFSGGTAAVFGAAGTAAAGILADKVTGVAFWIEPRFEVWQSLFTWDDWTEVVASGRWIPVWEPADSWAKILADRYHPLWDGGFQTLEWRPATQGMDRLWQPYRTATTEILGALGSDFSTQAKFGERWYRNTLVNLKHLRAAEAPGCPGARVVVAGAGPGLDDALDSPEEKQWIAARRVSGDRIFSTDTALPALMARGVVPDLVFCLDGQLPSYHHFVPERPQGVPLVADLAAMPFLGRTGMPVIRFLTAHPFGSVVRRFFPEIPFLDGSLGNVSGLAWYTAWATGAKKVDTWGADFSYRNGQAYAHGTYVYSLAERKSGRLSPIETLLGASVYGSRDLERKWDAQGRALDTTPLLREYRRRWDTAERPRTAVSLAHNEGQNRWEPFAAHWKTRLETLPLPGPRTNVHNHVRNLPFDRRQDWTALWPLALALHRQGVPDCDLVSTTVNRALFLLQD